MENREIINRILQLKKAKNAIILAHYYQNSEVQAIADYIGDSYQLSKIAKDNNASIIIFCEFTKIILLFLPINSKIKR